MSARTGTTLLNAWHAASASPYLTFQGRGARSTWRRTGPLTIHRASAYWKSGRGVDVVISLDGAIKKRITLSAPSELKSRKVFAGSVTQPTAQSRGAARHRETEQKWRESHAQVLREFEGQWVALEGEEIVAHGSDAASVAAEARRKGFRTPYVFYVEHRRVGVVKIGL